MTVPGPSDRTYEIDTTAPTLTDFTSLIVGEPSGVGSIESVLHELTGPGDSYPVHQPVAFYRADDIVVTFEADLGGSPDPVAEFYEDQTGSRTFTITFDTGWTFSTETYISKSVLKTSPEQLTLLEVTFRPTGTITIT